MKLEEKSKLYPDKFCHSAAILAGGKSSRMGSDKQNLFLAEQRLVFHLIDLLQAYFSEVIVVTKTASLYQGKSVYVTKDYLPSRGPLSGIEAALRISSSPYIYVTACDMPFFDERLLHLLLEKLHDSHPISGIAVEHRISQTSEKSRLRPQPFHAIYAKSLLDKLKKDILADRTRVDSFMYENNFVFLSEEKVRRLLPDFSVFSNVNTRSDAEKLDLRIVENKQN